MTEEIEEEKGVKGMVPLNLRVLRKYPNGPTAIEMTAFLWEAFELGKIQEKINAGAIFS